MAVTSANLNPAARGLLSRLSGINAWRVTTCITRQSIHESIKHTWRRHLSTELWSNRTAPPISQQLDR
jgi:hypothetical protein